jgi:hypothetical protein
MRSTLAPLLVTTFLAIAPACGHDGDGHTFATLTECVEEGHDLEEVEGIAHCLIDQGFGDGLTTVEECVAWVTDNGGYPDSRDEACALFIEETQD